jgi:5-methylcytosine-specific restriction endonuclease McrA
MPASRRSVRRSVAVPVRPPELAQHVPVASPSRADRLAGAVAAQAGRCFWCRRPFTPLVLPTTDHVVPRVKGGPSWRENEVAACRRCNSERGHLGPVEWLEECLRRGWPAEPRDLDRTLAQLDDTITLRGGQRRARPYLRSQRRRLARGVG